MRKAIDPSGIPILLWKCLAEMGIILLTKLFNEILKGEKMLDEW